MTNYYSFMCILTCSFSLFLHQSLEFLRYWNIFKVTFKNIFSIYLLNTFLYMYIFSYRGGNRHKAWSPACIMCVCLCGFMSLCACVCINRQIPWLKSTHLLTQQYINSRKILTSQCRLLWKEGEAINYSTQLLTCGKDRCRITDGI